MNAIYTGGPAFPGGESYSTRDLSGNKTLHEKAPYNNGISMRDYFAAKETLAEWDNENAIPSEAMCAALAGPKPAHGWSCKTPEEWVAIMRWEASWRAALKFIRADAMIEARKKGQQV